MNWELIISAIIEKYTDKYFKAFVKVAVNRMLNED